jgi:serine/threonine protein kinase
VPLSGFKKNPILADKVAIKILDKKKIGKDCGVESLLNEIRVHWTLEKCEGALKLFQIYEDPCYFELILEYQPKGSLMD